MGDAVEGTLLYWILDGAAHLDLPSVRDVVLDMLSDPPGERLQARLRVTRLRAMYEETENLGPVIGEMVALFDDVVPHSDPSSCGPDSPWFFLRTATLVRVRRVTCIAGGPSSTLSLCLRPPPRITTMSPQCGTSDACSNMSRRRFGNGSRARRVWF